MSRSLPTLQQRLEVRDRPPRPAAMWQQWHDLLFLHWEADPRQLSQRLPRGLHLDLFEDKAYLGIVPFFMRGVRPRGCPALPGLSNFLELNVRTYVHDDSGTPGVWFLSLDASNALACAIARKRFHLPYVHSAMSATRETWVDYRVRRKGQEERADFRYRKSDAQGLAKPGSLDFFLIERYVLFAHDPKSETLFRGRVHHPPYRLHHAEVERWSAAPASWNDLSLPGEPPVHAICAADVTVEVFSLDPSPRRG